MNRRIVTLIVGLVLLMGAQIALAAVIPADSLVRAKEFYHPGLNVRTELIPARDTGRLADLEALLIPTDLAYLDAATGRWATLIPTQPLIPGDGVGNNLNWGDLERVAPPDDVELAKAVEAAFRKYVGDHSNELRLSVSEFAPRLNVSVHEDTIAIYAERVIDGVPVRDSGVSATVSHGNLILMGAARWADMNVSAQPAIDEVAARRSLRGLVSDLPIDGRWGDTELVIVPFDLGGSLGYRLAYSLKPSFANELGNWEGLVDAHSGEILAFADTNHYATRHVVGGVYPESNDGVGPEGTEQLGWPMPWTNLGPVYTDSNGNFPGEYNGPASTNLDGLYIRINDNCGAVEEGSNGTNDIDFEGSAGTDCVTPPGASPGNTHSSRSGFYELNRIAQWARSRIPNNGWLSRTLVSNMNINSQCNAFWSGSVNFYRSGGGCANTGELAGVFDHEWGHGMDQNDNRPGISRPGEGIADIYAALRLNTSCIGRNFFTAPGRQCGGYGDPCLDCSGIRDIDFEKRRSQEPHDVVWIDDNCPQGAGTPCGGATHCEGAVYAESVWDLAKRDLPALGVEENMALEMTTWYTLVGGTNVGSWFTCSRNNEDGCAAEGGYLNYIAADDIDGDLSNGTPHMRAIYRAFNRHGIACSNPGVQDNGCEAAPTEAPVVTATAGDSSVSLSWDPVPGASRYHVFRTEGVKQCAKGKIYLGATGGTTFMDEGLLNGFEYYYTVTSRAGGRSCVGPMSACTAVTPN